MKTSTIQLRPIILAIVLSLCVQVSILGQTKVPLPTGDIQNSSHSHKNDLISFSFSDAVVEKPYYLEHGRYLYSPRISCSGSHYHNLIAYSLFTLNCDQN